MKLEHKILELECISPVHISSGETLKAFEYLYDRKTQQVYFLDESKWIEFLYRRNLIDKFTAYVAAITEALKNKSQFRGKNLWDWLNWQGVSDAEIKALTIRKAYAETNTVVASKKETLNDINCNIALSNGVPYIPGSSIKGMLRTGIIFAAIKKSPDKFRYYWQKIQSAQNLDLRSKNAECAKIIRQLENEVLAKLDYSRAEKDTNKKINPQIKDALRGLLVSDAVCSSPINTVILQKFEGNLYGDTNTLPLFCECIPAGTKFSFSVTLDLDMLNAIDISSISQILKMSSDFMHDSVNRLERFFGKGFAQEFAEAQAADIFLGGHVGFLSKSLLYALAPSHEQARSFAAEYFDQVFTAYDRRVRKFQPAHWHVLNSKKIAPRKLKLTRLSTNKQIWGLCKIQELENA